MTLKSLRAKFLASTTPIATWGRAAGGSAHEREGPSRGACLPSEKGLKHSFPTTRISTAPTERGRLKSAGFVVGCQFSGIKRAQAVVPPPFQKARWISTTARALSFSLALSTKPTLPPVELKESPWFGSK